MAHEICAQMRRECPDREPSPYRVAALVLVWLPELGAEQACRYVEKAHVEALMRLDEEQAKQAAELRDDPVTLAKFLVRAGRRHGF